MVDEGYEILRKYEFPINEYPELADFLAQHSDDLVKIIKATGQYSTELFRDGIPTVGDFITEERWPGFIRMVEAAGEYSHYLFQYDIHNVKDLINKRTWPDFVRMVEAGNNFNYLFRYTIPAVKDLINERTWPMFVDGFIRMIKASGENDNVRYLFRSGIPAVRDLITEERWPGFVRMAEASGENSNDLFFYGFPEIAYLINEETWPGFVRMVEAAGKSAHSMFQFGIPSVKHLITNDNFLIFVDGFIRIAKTAGENASNLYIYGIYAVNYLITENTWPILVKKLLKVLDYCKGVENETIDSLKKLKPLFNRFGIGLFDLLIFPTLKSQTIASFLCFKNYIKIEEFIQTNEDIKVILQVLKRRGFKANDFLEQVLVPGIQKKVILSMVEEKEHIIYFLKHSPIDELEIYKKYKNLKEKGDEKNLKKMFKDLKGVKKEIYNGILKKKYDENILSAVLYSVFSPELTVSRESYKQIYGKRNDRQVDIPNILNRLSGITVKISKGGYKLKENEEINTEAWNDLIEVVKEVNASETKTVDTETLGLELLRGFASSDLRKRKKYYLKKLYLFSLTRGEGLPDFNTEHSSLMKYKEFVGDRLKNDLIYSALKISHENRRQEFTDLVARIEKPKKFTGLAKQLYGLWMSKNPDKEQKIKKILSKNGILVDRIDWHVSSWEDVKSWLEHHSAGTMSKQTMTNIFAMLIGEDYNKMYKEVDKFEHTHHAQGRGGIKYTFMLSKRKLHSVAMFNMGVCVAPDDRLWNMPDFLQMIIWDKDKNACGGVIFRNVNNYLVLSIQPNYKILNEVSPVHLYDTIIEYSKTMVRLLKLKGVLIPVNSAIHSNRGSIQAIITGKNYTRKNFSTSYEFSYSPYIYSYNEFFVVP